MKRLPEKEGSWLQKSWSANWMITRSNRLTPNSGKEVPIPKGQVIEEPCDEKLSSTVLKGRWGAVMPPSTPNAYQSFFRGLRGKPKFKSIRHYSGWTYPASSGWKIHTTGDNGCLELTDLKVSIRMRGKARMWGKPTTCTIVYRNGCWYASITVECTPVRETVSGAIGIDFGTYHAAAMSDGTVIDNPIFQAKSAEKIKKASSEKRRKRAPNFRKVVHPPLPLYLADMTAVFLSSWITNNRA